MSQEIIQASGSPYKAHKQEGKPADSVVLVIPYRRWPTVVVFLLLLVVAGVGTYALVEIGLWLFLDATARAIFITGNTVNLFIFLAIVAQACIYLRQRRVMIEQWNAMQAQGRVLGRQLTHLEKIERAYVAVADMSLYSPQIGHKFGIRLTLLNGGKTPAWDVAVASQALMGVIFPVPPPPLPHAKPSEVFIPANIRKVSEVSFDLLATQERLDQILFYKTHKLFVFGEVQYLDFTGKQHTLPFHAEYDPWNNRFKEYEGTEIGDAGAN